MKEPFHPSFTSTAYNYNYISKNYICTLTIIPCFSIGKLYFQLKYLFLSFRSTRSPTFSYAIEKAEEMNAYLDHLQYDLYDTWTQSIDSVIEQHLNECLLATHNAKLIVNFSTQVTNYCF